MKIKRNKIYEIGEISKEEKLQADHKCGGELCIVCGYRKKLTAVISPDEVAPKYDADYEEWRNK